MGREREILRWEAHDTLLGDAIARAEDELAALPAEDTRSGRERDRAHALAEQIDDLRRRRRELGPSPKAKMG
ncbi:MAG TPA: hypothetical protein VJQ45_09940 [Ktedonobacterales bacterium]|nr:hypothetical protein [Ktedonobacterales bacterium]